MSEYCKATIYGERGCFRGRQCTRQAKRDGYCTQHHPDSVAKRREKRRENYEKRQKSTSWYRLNEALRKISELESKLEKARAVLDGAEYKHVDELLEHGTVEQCRQLGAIVAMETKRLVKFERDTKAQDKNSEGE